MIERAGNDLRVAGALTIANAVQVCDEGRQLIDGNVAFDLAGVTEVDSAALSVLFEWRRTARARNANVVFRNLPKSMMSLAALYGVADLVAPAA